MLALAVRWLSPALAPCVQWSDVANHVMCAVMDSGKHGTEHLPELAGRLAKYSDEKYNCTQLVSSAVYANRVIAGSRPPGIIAPCCSCS